MRRINFLHIHYGVTVFFGILLGNCYTVNAQLPVVAELDSAYVETGNACVIHLLAPKSASPYFKLDLSAWDSVLHQNQILGIQGPVLLEKRESYELQVKLLFFEEDTVIIPPVRLLYEDGNQGVSNALKLIVKATPSPDDLNDMRDIDGLRREPILLSDLWPWIAGIGGSILLVLGLFYWYARRNKHQFAQHRSVEKSPGELALKRLQSLKQKQLWEKGALKNYYDELSFILRAYVEGQYAIPALEMTTGEWLSLLGNVRDVDENALQRLKTFMSHADQAKFAKVNPPDWYHNQAWAEIFDWISQNVASKLT